MHTKTKVRVRKHHGEDDGTEPETVFAANDETETETQIDVSKLRE